MVQEIFELFDGILIKFTETLWQHMSVFCFVCFLLDILLCKSSYLSHSKGDTQEETLEETLIKNKGKSESFGRIRGKYRIDTKVKKKCYLFIRPLEP